MTEGIRVMVVELRDRVGPIRPEIEQGIEQAIEQGIEQGIDDGR